MIRVLAILVSTLAPIQAAALSCMPWTLDHAFQFADQSDARFIAVLGELSFDTNDLPVVDWQNQHDVPPETRFSARFDGRHLARQALSDVDIVTDVTVVLTCAGPWCGGLKPGTHLAFLERSEGALLLHVGACRSFAFGEPGDDMVQRVRQCLGGADCAPDPM